MNLGRIEQFDRPEAIYARRSTRFALNFVGLSSQWQGEISRVAADTITVQTASGAIDAPTAAAPGLAVGARVLVGVRPERIEVGRTSAPATSDATPLNRLALTVGETVYLGSRRVLYFPSAEAGAAPAMAEMPAHLGAAPASGERLQLSWPVGATLVYRVAASA